MLDANLKEAVDASATEDAFASLVTAALTTLVSALEARTEIATGITKINWGTLEVVGDQSTYVDVCNAALLAAVPLVHATAGGVIQNKHSTDVQSPPPHPLFCLS